MKILRSSIMKDFHIPDILAVTDITFTPLLTSIDLYFKESYLLPENLSIFQTRTTLNPWFALSDIILWNSGLLSVVADLALSTYSQTTVTSYLFAHSVQPHRCSSIEFSPGFHLNNGSIELPHWQYP